MELEDCGDGQTATTRTPKVTHRWCGRIDCATRQDDRRARRHQRVTDDADGRERRERARLLAIRAGRHHRPDDRRRPYRRLARGANPSAERAPHHFARAHQCSRKTTAGPRSGKLSARKLSTHVAHKFWLTPGVDGYFVASELPRDLLIARGVPGASIHVSGIPVSLEIGVPTNPASIRAHHGWPLDRPLISLLGGGIATTHVRQMVEGLRALAHPGTLVVVGGRNADVPGALADLTDGPHMRIQVLGHIDELDDLVAASDLVITKAGGLVVSEELARGTPLLVIDPIPGQEEWNADYVVSACAGVELRLPVWVPDTVQHLLAEPSRLTAMRERARRAGRP